MSSFGDLGRFFETALMHCLAERPKNKNYIFLNYFSFICDFFIDDFYFLELTRGPQNDSRGHKNSVE
jgi:hypothetical protein